MIYVVWAGEDTQKPASHVVHPLQCASMCWRYGSKRETDRFNHCAERWNWRLEGGEEQSAVSGQPCHLRAMSQSMPMQWQGLVSTCMVHITTREHEDVAGWGGSSMDAMGMCRTGPSPHRLQCSGEMALCLT